MPLTVLLIGYPFAPVGPSAVGGAEQVLSMIDEALVEAGHRSIVIAPEGSTCRGKLLATPRAEGPIDAPAMALAHRRHSAAIARALREERIDLLHLHGVDFDRYLPEAGPPVLVTLHLPPSFYAPGVLSPRRSATFLHCVSASQRRACPADATLLPDIPNGVRLDRFRFREQKKGFVLTLGALAGEWRELWERCPEATPFQRPEWLLPFCDHIGAGPLVTLALHEGGRLVGLAPLFTWDDGAERVISLLGAGVSDYLDVLFEPARAEAAARALSAHLSTRAASWDRCDFEPLRAASPLVRMPAPPGCRDRLAAEGTCPVLCLPADLTGLAGVVPCETLRNVRSARARAEERGRLALVTADAASRAEILEALIALHGRRWGGQGEPGMLADEAVRAFHREASAALLAGGALRLHVVTLDGQIIAALYGLSAHGVASFYLQGFDPTFERLSPGALVVAHAVEEAVRAGLREADFLRGQERYKYLWGAVDRPTFRRTFASGASPLV